LLESIEKLSFNDTREKNHEMFMFLLLFSFIRSEKQQRELDVPCQNKLALD